MEYRLEELFDLQMGKTPSRNNPNYWDSEDYKWISIGDLSKCGKYITETKEYLSAIAVEESGINLIPANTVIMSFKLSIGKTAITSESMYSNEAIMSFLDKHIVDLLPDYIYYMFSGKDWEVGTNKAVMGKTLNKATLSKIKVRIHSINDQKEIVHVLDKVKGIIDAREQELQMLDDLIKARFVEMFDSREKTTTISRYIKELRGGKSLAGTEPCKNKVLKTGAATFGWFDPEQYKYLPVGYEPLPEHKVETGDVIISRMNTPELVGACSYVFEAPEDMYYPDRLWKAVLQDNTDPIFLWQLLWDRDVRKMIIEKSGGTSGTMHNISKSNLLGITCINASIQEQEEFATLVSQVDKSKDVVQKALGETQILFNSLMQHYFG